MERKEPEVRKVMTVRPTVLQKGETNASVTKALENKIRKQNQNQKVVDHGDLRFM